jgi:hypothetical protein
LRAYGIDAVTADVFLLNALELYPEITIAAMLDARGVRLHRGKGVACEHRSRCSAERDRDGSGVRN